MDQNIISLVLKTGGYPEPVTVSGCHGNQVKFKISVSKKFLISPSSKNGLQTKFLHLLVNYGIFMRLTAISTHGNHLFFIKAP